MHYIITVNGKDYELSTTLRAAQAICNKYKLALPELAQKLETALPGELIELLKHGLQREVAKEFEDTVLDGGMGGFELHTYAARYLSELLYPGDTESKERQIEASPMDEDQKNGLRAVLGLPMKHSAVADSGSN